MAGDVAVVRPGPGSGIRPVLLVWALTAPLSWAQFYGCATDFNARWLVTASETYTWSPMPPQGCSCEQSDISSSECAIFECGCICDLTAGKCDYNCCCDTECTADEVARFQALDNCADEGPVDSLTLRCYDQDELDQVNPTYPLTGATSAEEALDGMLCVQFDNSDSKGEFYEDPGTFSSSIFGETAAEAEFAYGDYTAGKDTEGSTEGDATFDRGDRIPAAFADGSGVVAAYGGFLPLPTADNSGLCSEGNYAGFEEAVLENVCVRSVDNLEEQCAQSFGWQRFTSGLYVGTQGSLVPTSSPDAGDFVQVTVSSVLWRDLATGEESDFSAYNCDAYYYGGNSTTTASSSSSSSSTLSSSSPAPGGCVLGGTGGVDTVATGDPSWGCRNAIVSVCYTVTHDGAGSVEGVEADLVLADIPVGLDANGSAAVAQSFTVQYQSSASVDASQDAGNLVARSRSGNPGYRVGKPVLTGVLASDGDYIEATAAGLWLPGPGPDGACATGTGAAAAAAATAVGVEFGYDLQSCCGLTLNRTELSSLCLGEGPHAAGAGGEYPAPLVNGTAWPQRVGAYGNADPLDAGQWLALSEPGFTATAAWDEAAGECSGMVTALHYTFLYARVGAKGNAQNKIVAAEARFSKDDWVWRAEDTDRQPFLVCYTASFVLYDGEAEAYTPPPPPLAFTVPWDVFYPFSVDTSPATRAHAPPASPLLLLLLAAATAAAASAAATAPEPAAAPAASAPRAAASGGGGGGAGCVAGRCQCVGGSNGGGEGGWTGPTAGAPTNHHYDNAAASLGGGGPGAAIGPGARLGESPPLFRLPLPPPLLPPSLPAPPPPPPPPPPSPLRRPGCSCRHGLWAGVGGGARWGGSRRRQPEGGERTWRARAVSGGHGQWVRRRRRVLGV